MARISRRTVLSALGLSPFALGACAGGGQGGAPVAGFTVVRSFPHDPEAFTQGLLVDGDHFLESTGLVGQSSLRRVERATGRVLVKIDIPSPHFAEGLARYGDRLYQLTWRSRTGFVYDAATLARVGTFAYDGEGWGLTADPTHLILSDGTSRLRFLDPADLRVVRTVTVRDGGREVRDLNELEWIAGEVWANVWQTDRIVRIDPATGRVKGWIDLTGLLPDADRTASTDVLNGIAIDPTGERLFLTGKRWPKVFEVKIPGVPTRKGASRG